MSMTSERVVPLSLPASGADILRKVSVLAQGFRARTERTEAERNVPRESIEELIEAGVARMMVPREYGGLDLRARDMCEVSAAAAYGCASTGWLASLMCAHAHTFGKYPVEAQRAIWANGPDVVGAGAIGVKAKAVPGGYRVSGAGKFGSGVNYAEWVSLVGAVMREDGPPQVRFFLVPRSDYKIIEDWNPIGMRGTASNSVLAEDIFVPEAFTGEHVGFRDGTSEGAASNANPLFRRPFSTFSALGLLSAMVGAAEGAYDEMIKTMKTKRSTQGQPLAESEVIQCDIGEAHAKIRTARILLMHMADRTDSSAALTYEDRVTGMRDQTFAATLVKEGVDKLLEISGTSGFSMNNGIQQFWRDVNFAAAHTALTPRLMNGFFGRTALDVKNVPPPIFY